MPQVSLDQHFIISPTQRPLNLKFIGFLVCWFITDHYTTKGIIHIYFIYIYVLELTGIAVKADQSNGRAKLPIEHHGLVKLKLRMPPPVYCRPNNPSSGIYLKLEQMPLASF